MLNATIQLNDLWHRTSRLPSLYCSLASIWLRSDQLGNRLSPSAAWPGISQSCTKFSLARTSLLKFSLAQPGLRSCWAAWPRCSLLAKLRRSASEFVSINAPSIDHAKSVSRLLMDYCRILNLDKRLYQCISLQGSLDGAWLAWRSQWILGSVAQSLHLFSFQSKLLYSNQDIYEHIWLAWWSFVRLMDLNESSALFIELNNNASKSVSLNAHFRLHKVHISSAYRISYCTQITMNI